MRKYNLNKQTKFDFLFLLPFFFLDYLLYFKSKINILTGPFTGHVFVFAFANVFYFFAFF